MSKGQIFLVILFLTLLLSSRLHSQDQKPLSPDGRQNTVGQSFLAGVITAVNIPLRGILCVADAGMGFVVMGASAGRAYGRAAEIMEAGCSGPWIIDPRTIEERRKKQSYNYSEGFLDRR